MVAGVGKTLYTVLQMGGTENEYIGREVTQLFPAIPLAARSGPCGMMVSHEHKLVAGELTTPADQEDEMARSMAVCGREVF